MSDLTITISGVAGSGKTTLAYFIENLLLIAGIDVVITGNDEKNKSIYKDDLVRRMFDLRGKTTVLIQEVQQQKKSTS